jgi:predicted dehydrogenase
VRFGVLGTGHWAGQTQAAALAAHPEAELAGVWGRSPEKAAVLADRYGVRAYPDADGLIADVDAVAVALPPDVQAGLAERAAAAGRHLLLDKPVALSTEAADRVVAAAEAAGVASIVFFTRRFLPEVQEFIADCVANGPWHGVTANQFASIFQPGNPYRDSQWRKDKGGLWDIGPHALSVILPILGPVTEVAAVLGPRSTTHMLLKHASGAAGTVSLTLDAPPAATEREFVFFGEPGLARVPPSGSTSVEAFGAAIDALLADAAAGRADHPCGVRFGREVVAVLEAAERARDDGASVRPR